MGEQTDDAGGGGQGVNTKPPLDEESYFEKDLFYKRFGAAVSTAGFVLIILGLYVNYRQVSINTQQLQLQTEQLRLNTLQSEKVAKSIRATVTNSTVNHVTRLDEIFIERPYLTPYFYEGKPVDAKDEKHLEVYAMAVMVLDVFDVVGNQTRHYPEFWDSPGAWDEWVIDVFANSPVLRDTLDKHKNWYGEKMKELRRKGQVRMEENAATKANQQGT